MKMLIVDNEPRRYRRLREELISIDGIVSSDLVIVSNIEEAIENANQIEFDLILLDILIPYSIVDEDDKQNCIDFLEFLHNTCSNKPKRIIGITSDSTLIDEMKDIFSKNAWIVLSYSDSNDEWLEKILACVKYTLKISPRIENTNESVDILIICALQAEELSEILALPWNWEKNTTLIDENIFISYGSIELDGKIYKVAATHALRMGMVATSILCSRLIPLLCPKVVAMTGICGGNKEEVDLGDVIVAEASWNYQSGKVQKNKDTGEIKFKISPHHLNITNTINSFFVNISRKSDLLNKLKYKNSNQEEVTPQIKIGSIVSGASVIADDETILAIQDKQDRKVCGIEMEIYGFYEACTSAYYVPAYFALKGVSDFADSEKNENLQKIASRNSAVVLDGFLKEYIYRII
ncbi:hypothetical protein [Acinetobacter junii]|uniref:phosphorylase family protein n=1 Tax=Acinetobacter junii TaxID=40215 RepID=UPI0030F561C3